MKRRPALDRSPVSVATPVAPGPGVGARLDGLVEALRALRDADEVRRFLIDL